MRVLSTRTLQFEFLPPGKKYAILSHTWGPAEVTYQDMLLDPETARSKAGYVKISGLCKKAVDDGYDYCWADMCCINKESSAELGEAINSMYKWYEEADVCYALLTDVAVKSAYAEHIEEQLSRSKWFTRGWTLQELLAPKTVIFYDANWNMLGTKATMTEFLAQLTRIDTAVLSGEVRLSERSIAQRMSWAAERVTTREEDMAYCLLGIFSVNMPMLYGEGSKAFYRLQLQIIEQSDDHSIFAWPISGTGNQGMLADHPSAFRRSRNIVSLTSRRGRPPYRMTNRGLALELPTTPFATDIYLAQIDCYGDFGDAEKATNRGADISLAIYLQRLEEDDQFARVEYNAHTFQFISLRNASHRTNIKANIRQGISHTWLTSQPPCPNGFCITGKNLTPASTGTLGIPRDMFTYDATLRAIISPPHENFSDIGYLNTSLGKLKTLKLGFDTDFNPVIFAAASNGLHDYKPSQFSVNPVHHRYALSERERPTEEGLMQSLGILRRHANDRGGWSSVVKGNRVLELEFHNGLWAVTGDRVEGIDCVLDGSGGAFSGRAVRVRVFRDKAERGRRWCVEVGEVGG